MTNIGHDIRRWICVAAVVVAAATVGAGPVLADGMEPMTPPTTTESPRDAEPIDCDAVPTPPACDPGTGHWKGK